MSPEALAIVTAGAFFTSLLSGVVGMGGGITLLGVMALLLPAAWVVPLHAVVQLGSNTTRTFVFLRHVQWRLFAWYAPGLVVGVTVAALSYSGRLEGFKPYIGVFLLFFLLMRRLAPKVPQLPLPGYLVLGTATGFLTMYVGATGPFIAPFFLRDDLKKEEIVATKAVCQSVGHFLKIPAFLSLGFDYESHLSTMALLLGAVVIGTFCGKALLERMSRRAFVIFFETVLLVLALVLIGQGVRSYFTTI